MSNRLHLYRCFVDSEHSLSDVLYEIQTHVEKDSFINIDYPIVYIEDNGIKEWFLYILKNKIWVLLDRGEL